MSLASPVGALTRTKMLAAVSAANTAAATSAYIDVRGYDGQVAVEISQGVITGTVDYTFSTNDAANSSGATLIVPLGGALAQITTSNDDAVYTAIFDAKQLRGYLSVIGTVGTGPAVVSYTFIGRKKYAA
jgi:hypothetical protein